MRGWRMDAIRMREARPMTNPGSWMLYTVGLLLVFLVAWVAVP